jgi:DNA-binding protein H-NS
MKEINAISEQSDDLIEKLRDELRHKKDEEKRRIDLCKDVQQQISTLEEQFDSMDIDSQDHEDLQVRNISTLKTTKLYEFLFSSLNGIN